MASSKLYERKDGSKYYKIRVYKSADERYSMTWSVPLGWSKKSIERELAKVSAEFERRCNAGEFKNRRELHELLDEEKAKAEKELTLKQYGERVFMPQKTLDCSENTRAFYQYALNKRIYPALGNKKLKDITTAQINAFLINIQSDKISYRTVMATYNTLLQIITSAYMDETISDNPMLRVSRPKRQKSDGLKNEEIKAFNKEELTRIIECLSDEPLKWKLYVHLSIDTGARKGEICGLKWNSLNKEDGVIEIRENICYTASKGVYIETPKTGKSRIAFVSAETIKLWNEYEKESAHAFEKRIARAEPMNKIINFCKASKSEYVFTERGNSSPMHPQSPDRYFKRFSIKYNISDFHPHKLRHTFASLAIINGADIASVSEILGHADKATTLRMYTHADKEAKRKASEIFQNAIYNQA